MALLFLLLSAGAPVSLYYWWRKLQQLRLIEGTPLSRCRSAAQGYVALSGSQKTVPGHRCAGPMTGKSCTWWRYTVEQRSGAKGDKEWKTINDASSSLPFLVDDGTGQVMIAPEGAKVTFSSFDRWRGDAPWPAHLPDTNFLSGEYRYTEMRMSEGDPIFAIGDLGGQTYTNSPLSTGETISAILTTWKEDQAALLARFDADGNGQIDIHEWDKAREAAKAQAIAGKGPEPVVQPEPILSRPSDGRPFLLSFKAEQDVTSFLRKQMRFPLMAFIVCTLGALWLASK